VTSTTARERAERRGGHRFTHSGGSLERAIALAFRFAVAIAGILLRQVFGRPRAYTEDPTGL
jgi:hypothetical protein